MIEILYRIFIGHNHKWEIIQENKIYEQSQSPLPLGTKYTLQCIHCGKIEYKKNFKE